MLKLILSGKINNLLKQHCMAKNEIEKKLFNIRKY